MWLGMSKIGVIGALVNFNLRTTPLAHCIKAADAKAVIFSYELTEGKYLLWNLILIAATAKNLVPTDPVRGLAPHPWPINRAS